MKTLLHYFFLLCLSILLPAVHNQCIKDQQQSLLHLKKSLQFDQPSPLISWNSSTDCCSWVGVTCTSNGHVVGLDLSNKTISGPIPGSFANFSNLRVLNLSSNTISGTVPGFFANFSNLRELDLRGNNISGPIPGFFANFSNLKLLDLSENHIRGKIPHWIWSSNQLSTINLSCNDLVALEAPLPNSTVETVDLHSNQLQGQIPTFLPSAKYLDYSRNNFISIPLNIGDFLTKTLFFSLSSNNLHGLIPASICKASNLQILNLSNNSLSGMIPQCLTAMRDLNVLNLARNNLTGSISNVEVTEDLQILEIGGNQLGGKVPKSLAKCTMLEVLNIGKNNITDSFPCLLKNISTLRVVILRSNNFYGGIECLNSNGTWPKLQIIDLAHNNFSGEIQGILWRTWREMMATENGSLSKIVVGSHTRRKVFGRTMTFSSPRSVNFCSRETYNQCLAAKSSYAKSSYARSSYARSSYDNSSDAYDSSYLEYGVSVTVTSKGLEMELVKIISIFTLIDFSSNNFSGPIPKEIGEFKSLRVLNLSGNAFIGEIPSSIPTSNQFSTFPPSSFTGNKGLWGFPLTVDNKAGFPPPPTVNGRPPNSGHHHEVNWDLISAEIGFIAGFGVAIGSLVLCKRWSKWYYRAMYNILLKIFPQLEERIGIHRKHVHINQR
ncbi:putative LRR receptor-like serine/threonine-protein kinase [Prunus yedoensis var. nudiflora]|uniref:Putative LRR receptor-like serine/threonine-protein kinase n=1 Tax=Prunus yedoensis var. nudiflora TaxID=2094558 RepID=A0A314V554_PRUYE|nr:putative LRR receptor-like serine/threonine-protein kinase [Prunus yedoensis var. nudiflora]